MAAAPPPFLPTSALSLEMDALLSVTASMHAGIADARATFECSLKTSDPNLGFFIFAGLDPLLSALEHLSLSSDELDWLGEQGIIDARARKRLADMTFRCDIDAAPEGSVVFPNEPVLTVEGPYWQAQLVSAFVRGALSSSTLAATKAARCVRAAKGGGIIEASAATAHRLGGNPLVARAAYIGGAHATTCAIAAKRFGIPVRGSLPRRFLCAPKEQRGAFDGWLAAHPHRPLLRIDHSHPGPSLDALIGAITREAPGANWNDDANLVEIGGGDRVAIAELIFQRFHAAKLPKPHVIASGGLDELRIAELVRKSTEAKIEFSAFFVSAFDIEESALVPRYELTAIEEDGQWSPRARASHSLATSGIPGRKVTARYSDGSGALVGDVSYAPSERLLAPEDLQFVDLHTGLATRVQSATQSKPLLESVMRSGKRSYMVQSAEALREQSNAELHRVPAPHLDLITPARYSIGISAELANQRAERASQPTIPR